MRRDVILLGFVAGVFLLGAILSPPVYSLAQVAARRWPAVASLADQPFPRYMNRIMLATALLGLYPLMRSLRASPSAIGISRPNVGNTLGGLVLALLVLGGFVSLAFAADARSWRPGLTGARLEKSALLAFGGAAIAAPLEELVFRGVLFGLLRRPSRWGPALIISSAIFAIVHFLHKPGSIDSVQWHTGFVALGRMIVPQSSEPWLAQALNLTLCGGLLSWGYQRTGALWFSIGLHAGWIFWLKLANTVTISSAAQAPFWGSRKVVDGWGATVALVLTALLIPILARPPHHPHHDPEPSKALGMG